MPDWSSITLFFPTPLIFLLLSNLCIVPCYLGRRLSSSGCFCGFPFGIFFCRLDSICSPFMLPIGICFSVLVFSGSCFSVSAIKSFSSEADALSFTKQWKVKIFTWLHNRMIVFSTKCLSWVAFFTFEYKLFNSIDIMFEDVLNTVTQCITIKEIPIIIEFYISS